MSDVGMEEHRMSRMNRQPNPSSGLRKRVAVLILTFACITTASLLAAAAPPTRAATPGSDAVGLQKDLDAVVAAGAPGAILLIRNGTDTVSITSGLADVAAKRPMQAIDHFRAASLTKTYVATVVLQLVGEGKLHLSDSIERRLPGLVPNGERITIRQLLNHTSGLFDDEHDAQILKPYYAGELDHYWSMQQLVQQAVTHKPLFAPGTSESYSNTNYILAALIVKAVTGRPIGTELRNGIFRPLRLADTTYPTTPRMPNPYAHGYMIFGKHAGFDISHISPSLYASAGAIISTVGDVADFYRGLLAGRLLQPGVLKEMKPMVSAGPTAGCPARCSYGLGLIRWPTACGLAWGGDGGIPGYDVRSLSTENGQRQAVLMINHDPDTFPKPARLHLQLLFDRLITKAYCTGA
jgi:D-alanyl-D-alanine carboxypeptidase